MATLEVGYKPQRGEQVWAFPWETGCWGESQHSQIQPDLLEGHKLPSHSVPGLIDHPVGPLSDLLYPLEHIHVCRAALGNRPHLDIYISQEESIPPTHSSLHVTPTTAIAQAWLSPCTPATHLAWEDGSRLSEDCFLPSPPNPAPGGFSSAWLRNAGETKLSPLLGTGKLALWGHKTLPIKTVQAGLTA